MKELSKDNIYYFVDKEILIINYITSFNIAVVRYIDSLKEFVVDINFIEKKPVTEKFISIKDMKGAKE